MGGRSKASGSRDAGAWEDQVELVRAPSKTSDCAIVDDINESGSEMDLPVQANRSKSAPLDASGSFTARIPQEFSRRLNFPQQSDRHGSATSSDEALSVEVPLSRQPSTQRRRRRSTAHRSMNRFEESLSIGLGVPSNYVGMGEDIDITDEGDRSDDLMDEDGHSAAASLRTAGSPEDDSIYPQVRASVPATDDTSLSINTPRMWSLSLLFAFFGSATNLFFSLRYPSVALTPVIALILVHPLGVLWDVLLKRQDDVTLKFVDGVRTTPMEQGEHLRRRTRFRCWLAQGAWNEKEHACVYVSSNVAFGFAFATDVIVEQKMFYHQTVPLLYQVLLTLSTQILGYAFAGITRRYLVRPPAMIWPATLMSTAMFTTIHRSENKPANGWIISRWHFFVLVWVASFTWYFVPGLLMPALSFFNVLTWFAPNSIVIANLFGVSSGLGMFPVTFDWAQLAYIGSPLLTPWWAAANVVAGLAIIMWLVAPIMYYSNVLSSAYMPILSSSIFDNTGQIYNVSKILTEDFLFDEEAFKQYSPIYLPITYVLSYGVQFASLTALVAHTICWHGEEIWKQTKNSFGDSAEKLRSDYRPLIQDERSAAPVREATADDEGTNIDSGFEIRMSGVDVHNRLMERYEDAPISWYLIILVAMLAIGVFLVEYYPVYLPWYGLLLALGITAVMFLPVAIIMAITNQHSSLYLIAQLVCGIVFPGRPVANMVFVTYAYISSTQGIKFASDLKLGHYMKIPPRILFTVQLVATVVGGLTQVGVLNWMFHQVRGLCTPEAINGFTCPIARVHFNGSILWGVVGPHRFFGAEKPYGALVWAFAFGAVAPVVVWYIASSRPSSSRLRRIHLPLLLGSISWIPPATGLNFSGWALICYTFNYAVRRRAAAWWSKYNMTLSAALDSGLAFGLVVAFFGFVYPGFMENFKWWGTEIYKQGCDWQACPMKKVAPGQHFGPDQW